MHNEHVEKEKMKAATLRIRMPSSMLVAVRRLVRQRGMTLSTYVRALLIEQLEKVMPQQKNLQPPHHNNQQDIFNEQTQKHKKQK